MSLGKSFGMQSFPSSKRRSFWFGLFLTGKYQDAGPQTQLCFLMFSSYAVLQKPYLSVLPMYRCQSVKQNNETEQNQQNLPGPPELPAPSPELLISTGQNWHINMSTNKLYFFYLSIIAFRYCIKDFALVYVHASCLHL